MVSLLCEAATQPRSPVPAAFRREQSSISEPLGEAASDNPRRGRDRFPWFGISGADSGTSGGGKRAFLYVLAFAAIAAGVSAAHNVIAWLHGSPGTGLAAPIVAEATSWFTFVLFFWIPWTAWLWTLSPTRPRWKLAIHIPGALGFALCHVGGFVLLRRLAAWMGGPITFDRSFATQFLYEVKLDGLTYLLLIASFTLFRRLGSGLPREQAPVAAPDPRVTFDIRDGAKLIRVRIDDILAVSSAGNYVEFTLGDGRRPLMRASLSALESELASLGFLRTHRSWLVNSNRVTALKPSGSGDYVVEVATISVPLSRRYSLALAKLRGASA